MEAQRREKARNEKFIFAHVEVLFIFMLFHVKGGEWGTQNKFCCFMNVCYGSENIDFPFSGSNKKVCA